MESIIASKGIIETEPHIAYTELVSGSDPEVFRIMRGSLRKMSPLKNSIGFMFLIIIFFFFLVVYCSIPYKYRSSIESMIHRVYQL